MGDGGFIWAGNWNTNINCSQQTHTTHVTCLYPTEAAFVISLLTIAAIFDFTKDLQSSILQEYVSPLHTFFALFHSKAAQIWALTLFLTVLSLQTSYTEEALTWDFMARRELEAPSAGEELQTAKGRASDMIRTEERCSQVYEEGIKSLNSGTTLYVHTLRTHAYGCLDHFSKD